MEKYLRHNFMPNKQSFITLLTDFGNKDQYVSSMKGVIYSINPFVKIIDILHEIPRHDILNAAFQIFISYHYFPKGTVHVIVVDPGVGSSRKILAVKTKDYYFIAPDNGVLSYVLQNERNRELRIVRNKKYFLKNVSTTFHGRDIFTPVAAYLTASKAVSVCKTFKKLGPVFKKPLLLSLSKAKEYSMKIHGNVIHVDAFGNLVTNINVDTINKNKKIKIKVNGNQIDGISHSYKNVAKGKLIALRGSSGFFRDCPT